MPKKNHSFVCHSPVFKNNFSAMNLPVAVVAYIAKVPTGIMVLNIPSMNVMLNKDFVV